MPKIEYRNKEGHRLSGVTTIISTNLGWNKRALMYWANLMGLDGKSHQEVAQEAADAGTLAHAMVEADLKGKDIDPINYPPDVVEKAETAYLAWLEWKGLVDFSVIASEKSLVSEKHQFGGTIDIASVKKKTCIVDLKTSNAVYPDHQIQIAAYGQLWNENYPDNPIEAYYLLKLGKNDGSFAYYYWPSLARQWEAFLHLLDLNRLKKELKG